MTDTPEAVRLADELDKWARNYASTTYEDDMATKSAALLRRIPELDAEVQEQALLNGMGAERELALRAQVSRLEAEKAAWKEHAETLTHQVICCGVAASHPDPALTTRGAYAGKWNSAQAEKVRKLREERDQLRAELEKVRVPDVDDLAQFIRWVSGNNKMGAGVLAERITEWLAAPTPPHADQKGAA